MPEHHPVRGRNGDRGAPQGWAGNFRSHRPCGASQETAARKWRHLRPTLHLYRACCIWAAQQKTDIARGGWGLAAVIPGDHCALYRAGLVGLCARLTPLLAQVGVQWTGLRGGEADTLRAQTELRSSATVSRAMIAAFGPRFRRRLGGVGGWARLVGACYRALVAQTAGNQSAQGAAPCVRLPQVAQLC